MKRVFLLIFAALLTVSMLSCNATIQNDNVKTVDGLSGTKIEFPGYGDGRDTSVIKLNEDEIKKSFEQLPSKDYFIYGTPRTIDFSIAEKFGFDKNDYSPFGNDGNTDDRIYKTDDLKKLLHIDCYGALTFTDDSKSNESFELSKDECFKIARKYLEDNGMWKDDLSQTWTVNEWSTTSEGVKKINGYGINLFREFDGVKVVGNSRMTVDVYGEGKVGSVLVNMRTYTEKSKADLISVEEALDKIKNGDARVSFPDDLTGVEITTVKVCYYADERDSDNLFVQPVFLFADADNKVNIAVQANRIK